jgi:hydrogenase maturation protease
MITVIGCGNANRSDDAVGIEVVRLLNGRNDLRSRTDVRLLDAGTDGMAVMFAARGCKTLIVIDSCQTGAEPGAIFKIPGSEVESEKQPSLNLHDFRWDHALYAGRKMYGDAFPTDVTVYLIEARSCDFGIGLSREIETASKAVAESIEVSIASMPTSSSRSAEG